MFECSRSHEDVVKANGWMVSNGYNVFECENRLHVRTDRRDILEESAFRDFDIRNHFPIPILLRKPKDFLLLVELVIKLSH